MLRPADTLQYQMVIAQHSSWIDAHGPAREADYGVPLLLQGIDARGVGGAAWAFEMAEAAAGRARSRAPATVFLQTAFGTVVAIVQHVRKALQGALADCFSRHDICSIKALHAIDLGP